MTDKVLSRLRLKSLGFIFQSFNLDRSALGLRERRVPRMVLAGAKVAEARERVECGLTTRSGLTAHRHHRVTHLSGDCSGSGSRSRARSPTRRRWC